MFRGVQFADASFQPAATLTYGGFYGGVWLNLPIGDNAASATPSIRELDLIAGYGAALSEIISIDVGVTYYALPDFADGFFDIFKEDDGGDGANTVEPYIGVAIEGLLSPTIYVYRDFMFDTFTVEGSVSHSFPIEKKVSVDLGGTVGYVVDDDIGTDYLYGHATADLSYAFSDAASAYVGARFGGSNLAGGSVFDDLIEGTFRASGFWFGAGLKSTF